MDNCNSKAINEAIELLSSLNSSKIQLETNSSAKVSDEISVETIIQYLDRSKEIVSKFKDLDTVDDRNSRVFKRRFWRKFLGHIVKAIGEFLVGLGEKLIRENP